MIDHATERPSMEHRRRAQKTCRKIRAIGTLLIVLCVFIQIFLDDSFENIAAAAIIALISILTLQATMRARLWRIAPLSQLVVLGFNISTMSGALIAKTSSAESLTSNLHVPILTFGACALFQMSLLAANFIWAFTPIFRGLSQTLSTRLIRPLGIMTLPRPAQLWVMGAVGSIALAWTAISSHGSGIEYGDVGGKLLSGLSYLAYAPFLIPFQRFINPGGTAQQYKPNILLLIGYLAILVLLGMAVNSRGTFSIGVANLGLATMLLILLGQLPITVRLRRILLIGGLAMLLIMPALADIAIAMVVVRGERGSLTPSELIARTVEAFQDKRGLYEYRENGRVLTGTSQYEESYIENPFIARFIQTKFVDNTLSLEDVRTGKHATEIWSVSLDKISALLPTPILSALGIEVDKSDLGFSMGDALYFAETGSGLGGFRTGSAVGHGIALMGGYTFIVATFLFLTSFIPLQAMTAVVEGAVVISPVILLQLMPIFGLAAGDSLFDPINLILRGLPQNIFVYWTILQITRMVGGRASSKGNAIRSRGISPKSRVLP